MTLTLMNLTAFCKKNKKNKYSVLTVYYVIYIKKKIDVYWHATHINYLPIQDPPEQLPVDESRPTQ